MVTVKSSNTFGNQN